MHGSQLVGFTVGVTADRRGDEQALMLSRLGIDVVRGPAIMMTAIGDDARLRPRTEALIDEPPDFLVANTGVGMRGWLGQAAAWGLDVALAESLRSARIAARGPKAAAAVGIAGLEVWWRAEDEQLVSVGRRLLEESLAGKRVAVQLHGDDHQELTTVLAAAGARVVELPVYRWTLPADDRPARALVERCCTGGIDAITFTAGPTLRNLVELADRVGRARELLEALNHEMVVACMGPVCAAVAAEVGITEPLVPDQWRLGSLVRLVADSLLGRRRPYSVGAHQLVLQGSVALVDGQPMRLTALEHAVLAKLAAEQGATVSRRVLLRDVWKDAPVDPHVLETVVGRLRSKLGPAGGTVETAVRRGYRLQGPHIEVG